VALTLGVVAVNNVVNYIYDKEYLHRIWNFCSFHFEVKDGNRMDGTDGSKLQYGPIEGQH